MIVRIASEGQYRLSLMSRWAVCRNAGRQPRITGAPPRMPTPRRCTAALNQIAALCALEGQALAGRLSSSDVILPSSPDATPDEIRDLMRGWAHPRLTTLRLAARRIFASDYPRVGPCDPDLAG
jgi:hypothetical protein